MDRILLFTDGACSGNPGPGGWAAIVATPDGKVRELAGGDPKTTNNRMEMIATLEALRAITPFPDVGADLYTDSTYVISGITQWVHGWKRKGWTRADGGAVLNRDLWEALDAANAGRRGKGPVEWRYVRGHSGHGPNERCDEIAVAKSLGHPVTLYSGPRDRYAVDLSPPATETPSRGNGPKPSGGPGGASGSSPPRGEPEGSPKTLLGPPDRSGRDPGAERGRTGKPVYLSLVDGKLERHATWSACESRVKGRPNARYRKATSPAEEAAILASWGVSP